MRILEFIKQNCKDVEFHALGDVCNKNSFKQIGAGELENLKVNNPKEPIKLLPSSANYDWISDREICKDFICKGEVITLGRARYANLKYHNGEFISSNNILISAKTGILGKFLYYFIENNKEKFYVATGTYPKFDMKTFDNFKIPVPSLEVQNKIVEVLDSFTSLERSLEREKLAREKQYKYYLNHLITNARNSRILKLGEVCEFVRGGNFQKKDFLDSGFACIHYGQIYTHYGIWADKTKTFISPELAKKQKIANKNDIVMAITSENVEDVCKCTAWLGDEPVAVGGHSTIIKHNQNAKFLSYYFHSNYFANFKPKIAQGVKVMEVYPKNLAKVEIPLPPLDEQERIVRILDSLNELANGLSAGIPKEIELRQKQYEYWRDRLLEFPSKDSKW